MKLLVNEYSVTAATDSHLIGFVIVDFTVIRSFFISHYLSLTNCFHFTILIIFVLNDLVMILTSFATPLTYEKLIMEMRYRNVTSLYFATPVAFNATERFPWDDLHKILDGGQRMAKVQNGGEILWKISIP